MERQKAFGHSTKVSSSVWSTCQSKLGCLKGMEEAVILSVSGVAVVIFNREAIIWHNKATEDAVCPPGKCSQVTDIIQQRKAQQTNLDCSKQQCLEKSVLNYRTLILSQSPQFDELKTK